MVFTTMNYLYSVITSPPRGENALNLSLKYPFKIIQRYILTHRADSWSLVKHMHNTQVSVFKANRAQPHGLPAVAPCLCTNSEIWRCWDLHGKNNPRCINPFWKRWSYSGKGSNKTLFRKCPIKQIFHQEKGKSTNSINENLCYLETSRGISLTDSRNPAMRYLL